MIVLSVGMPRAGSGWYYNLTNDLMLANGAQDARQIRQRFHLTRILTEVNCNIGALTPRRILAVLLPSLLGNTFAIKAHAAPSSTALLAIRMGLIRPTYIYRDPRDAMLSAMENGQRALQRGRPNAFSPYVEFSTALNFMLGYLRIWEAWVQCEQALLVKYENLLSNYDVEVNRLLHFLDLRTDAAHLHLTIEKYRPEQAKPNQKGLHYVHGRIGRFRQKFSQDQQAILAEKMGGYLKRMGYEP